MSQNNKAADTVPAWVETVFGEAVSTWLNEHPATTGALGLALLLLVCALLVLITRTLVLPTVRRAIKKSAFEWDDVFVDHKFFRWLSLIIPAVVAYVGAGVLPGLSDGVVTVVRNVAAAVMVLAGMMAALALINGLSTVYARREGSRNKPIRGYVQILKVFISIVGTLIIIANLADQDLETLLAGVGAMTAVLLLIFKDTILGLVASVQLSSNDMVRVGDWIEMPKYGADGDVIDIALHTVKVQNWDKTITTIPSYALISDSFKNWRGMQECGGRRIKRNIHLDMSTVRFLSANDLERFGKFALLSDYIAKKREALEDSNAKISGDATVTANSRQLTNLGTFRAYLEAYLHSHPAVHLGMTFLVRQLQPTEYGLPLEIYIFTRTIKWAEYEAIQADIFDHILAIIPEFGLAVFQRPAGRDLAMRAPSGA